MNNGVLKTIININPYMINHVKKEDITDEIIDILIKKNVSYTLDSKKALSSNYKFVKYCLEKKENINIFYYIDFSSFNNYELNELFKVVLNNYSNYINEFFNLSKTNITTYNYNDIVVNKEIINKLTDTVTTNIPYNQIPDKIKLNNFRLCEKYFNNNVMIEMFPEMIKNCSDKKEEILENVSYLIANNIDKYQDKIAIVGNKFFDIIASYPTDKLISIINSFNRDVCQNNINNIAKIISKLNGKQKDKVIKHMINLNVDLSTCFEQFNSSNDYLLYYFKNYYMNNDFNNNFINYFNKLDNAQTIELIKYYFTNNIKTQNMSILLNRLTFDEAKEIKSLLVDMLVKDEITPSVLPYNIKNVLINDTPKLVSLNINNIKLLSDYPTTSIKEISNEIIGVLINNKYKFDESTPKCLVDIIQGNNKILFELLSNGCINKDIINVDKIVIDDDFMQLYDYVKNNSNINEFDPLLTKMSNLKTVNLTNFNNVRLDEDLVYIVNESNKEKIKETIKTLKDRKDFNKNVIIECDRPDINYLTELGTILGNRVLVRPQHNQNIGYSTYTIEEIKRKELILDTYASSILESKDKDGNKKELSPLEKYLAAYKIVTSFSHYIREDKSKDNPDVSRAVYQLIGVDDVKYVCSGYVNLLIDLLERVGLSEELNWSVKAANEYHARILIRIKDPKYNIDGIYMGDPTWDGIDAPINNEQDLNSSKYKHALLTVEEAIKDRTNFNDPIKDLNVNSIPLAIKNKLVDGNSAEEKENLCKNLLNNPIDKETIAKALVSIDYFNYRDKKMPDVSDIRNSTDEELVEDYNEKLIKLGEYEKLIKSEKIIDDWEKTKNIAELSDLIIHGSEMKKYYAYKVFDKLNSYIKFNLPNIMNVRVMGNKISIHVKLNANADSLSDSEYEKLINDFNTEIVNLGLPVNTSASDFFISFSDILDNNKTIMENYEKIENVIDNVTGIIYSVIPELVDKQKIAS